LASEFEEQIARFRTTVDDAANWSNAAATTYGQIAIELERAVRLLEESQRKLEAERAARETVDRHKERFRYALWIYLQERDGLAGIHAPTPETLKLIRELVTELGG
jgi:hypothetical protein